MTVMITHTCWVDTRQPPTPVQLGGLTPVSPHTTSGGSALIRPQQRTTHGGSATLPPPFTEITSNFLMDEELSPLPPPKLYFGSTIICIMGLGPCGRTIRQTNCQQNIHKENTCMPLIIFIHGVSPPYNIHRNTQADNHTFPCASCHYG